MKKLKSFIRYRMPAAPARAASRKTKDYYFAMNGAGHDTPTAARNFPRDAGTLILPPIIRRDARHADI